MSWTLKKNTNEFILIFYFFLVKFENAYFLNITKRFFIRVWENIIIFFHRWGCWFVPAMVGWRDRTLPPRPHVPSCRPSDVALPDETAPSNGRRSPSRRASTAHVQERLSLPGHSSSPSCTFFLHREVVMQMILKIQNIL